jgi:predicted esterase
MTERHLEVTRTARYWTAGQEEAPEEVWFVLHGYRQLARRFIRRFEPIAGAGRLVVAPEGLSRFYVSSGEGRHGSASVVGASWMTREDREHEIADYVAYLDRLARKVLGAGPASTPGRPRLVVLGFSQGVATATRWVVRGGIRPDRLLLWGDFTPPDLDLAAARTALEGVEVVAVRGNDDPALTPRLAEEEAVRLHRGGLTVRFVRYDGGHEIDPDALVALAEEGRGA